MTNKKKIKGQLPYTLFVNLKKEASIRIIPMSELILQIVRHATLGPDRYSFKEIEHAESVRGDSPNNCHFLADDNLVFRFEMFKRTNRLSSDSAAIRSILFKYYEKTTESSHFEQPTFF